MADQKAPSPLPDREQETSRVNEKRPSPVTQPTLKKGVLGTARMQSYETIDHHAKREKVSPTDISMAARCSGQGQKTSKKIHRPPTWTTNNNLHQLGLASDVVGANGHHQESGGYVDQHFFEAGIKCEDVNFFALNHQKSAAGTDMSMNTANFSLKTQVGQLLNDNEELNHRFRQINQKNQVLAVERERLLTTIRNTSAILQSTFSTISHDNKELERIRYQMEEAVAGKNEKDHRFIADFKSSNSDSLERSTRYTIKEFDNLLSALHGTKTGKKKDRRACTQFSKFERPSKANNMSQYDIIVKWLNNKTTTWHSDEGESSSADEMGSSSASSVEDEIHDKHDAKNERKHKSIPVARSPSATQSDQVEPDNASTGQAGEETQNIEMVGDQDEPTKLDVNTPDGLLPSVDNGNMTTSILNTPSVVSVENNEEQLLSECLKNIDPTALTLVAVGGLPSRGMVQEADTSAEERPVDLTMRKESAIVNDDGVHISDYRDERDLDVDDRAESIDFGTVAIVDPARMQIAIPVRDGVVTDPAHQHVVLSENEPVPLITSSPHPSEVMLSPLHQLTEDNVDEYLENWFAQQENDHTPVGPSNDRELQQGQPLPSELMMIENRSECGGSSQNGTTESPCKVEEQSSLLAVPEKVTPLSTTNDKKEFLQDWLQDLRTRTQLYSKKSQYGGACDSTTSVHNGESSKWAACNSKSNPIVDEHEEFIALCKAMMNRMDLMISRSAECQMRDSEFLGTNAADDQPSSARARRHQCDEKEVGGTEISSLQQAFAGLIKKRKLPTSALGQRTLFSQDGVSNAGPEFDGSVSSTSSNFSLADLATTINVDLESDDHPTNLKMFQKCLANLEEMNMRRTNNALTQTLIIKVLRKLMAKQLREERAHCSNNDVRSGGGQLSATAANIESTNNGGSSVPEPSAPAHFVQKNENKMILGADERPATLFLR